MHHALPVLRRLRPRSVRGRYTVAVGLMAIVLFTSLAVIGIAAAHQAPSPAEWAKAERQASTIAEAVRRGQVSDPIAAPDADLVQVVAADRHVIASSAAARGMPPMTDVWPPAPDSRMNLQVCADGRRQCLRISAIRVSPDSDSPVVYVGNAVPLPISTTAFTALWATQIGVLTVAVAWATRRIIARVLRPMEAIRAELAAINVNDLNMRIPAPTEDEEFVRLARTINHTLGRLESAQRSVGSAYDRQRQFAADASHELRTPLAGLRVQLEAAQLHPDDVDLPGLLDHCLGDLDRVENIIADLLLLTRLGANVPGTLERVDLASIVRAQVARRNYQNETRLDLESGVMVDAAPIQIARAVTNLLDNAHRHAKRTVWIGVRRTTEGAELAVSDDGHGIAEADRERIFHRFVRLDTARSRLCGGPGLGLAIARDIAAAHNGTLHVEDSASGGARFVLRLPLAGQGRLER